MKQKEIIKHLNKNGVKNISLIGVIENYGIESSFQAGDSLLITVKTDHLWCYPAAENEQELKELLRKLKYRTLYFASLENWMLPVISQNKEIEWELKTDRLILPKKPDVKSEMHLESEIQNKSDSRGKNNKGIDAEFEIRKLKLEDTDFIFTHSHYQNFTSKSYIRDRIAADCSAGIIIDGELAAWGLTHDDGALGFIHVRNNFRKRGCARLIMEKLISDKRRDKKNIFLNVEPDNLKAKKLFYSLGFEFDRMISWIKLKQE